MHLFRHASVVHCSAVEMVPAADQAAIEEATAALGAGHLDDNTMPLIGFHENLDQSFEKAGFKSYE